MKNIIKEIIVNPAFICLSGMIAIVAIHHNCLNYELAKIDKADAQRQEEFAKEITESKIAIIREEINIRERLVNLYTSTGELQEAEGQKNKIEELVQRLQILEKDLPVKVDIPAIGVPTPPPTSN